LPYDMTEAHIVPEFEHSSLTSTKKLRGAGCKVVFDEQEYRVCYRPLQILTLAVD